MSATELIESEAVAVVSDTWPCVISTFRRVVGENCALLGYYTASSGNSVPTFRDNQSHFGFSTLENGIDTSSQIVGKQLPAAL